MKRIDFLLIAVATVAGVVALTIPASGQADEEAPSIYGVIVPNGDRDWKLITVSDTNTKPLFVAGAWQLDNRLSDAQLTTEATTDYGKRKVDLTLGFRSAGQWQEAEKCSTCQ